MQWLINLVLESLKGIIVQWSGAIVDIPAGWTLCDGTAGTPDLRDKFIVGAGSAYAVGAAGGQAAQTHTFTSNTHFHWLPGGPPGTVGPGLNFDDITTLVSVTGTTDAADNRPPYYALAYIMKL